MKKYLIAVVAICIAIAALAAIPTIEDFFLPGSQEAQSGNIESPDKCDNCHGGYDAAVEPAFNWRGSMMSQSARDPLFYACLAIANQDAPGAGDLCLRCHTPDGWLNGRCVPTDGSALNNNDRQGVQCDFCHKMVKPTPLGVNPFPGNTAYTSTAFGTGTYTEDQSYLGNIIPIPGTSANGMYIADANNGKRGPFTDAVGRHQMFYSPFHSQSEFCGTCHDVSNPVFTRENTSITAYAPNTMNQASPTFDLRLMFPIERTYSEWLASGYNSTEPSVVKTCQDCHMKDVTGKGAKMRDAPLRTNLPLHDMTGGNTFIPLLVKQLYPSEVDAQALDAGIQRSRNNLQNAANLELTVTGNTATVKVTNLTGHKLPSGYPEGRRMWINMKFFNSSGQLLGESGAYDLNTAVLDKSGAKVYECEPGISADVVSALNPERPASHQLSAGASFHMALNNQVVYDNRIPPYGFTNAKLEMYQSPVIGAAYPDGQNFDITTYTLPENTAKVEARLFYQTTSREFVEFLRDENYTNTKGQEMYDLWAANGKSTPELMRMATWPSLVNVMNPSIQSVLRTTNRKGDAYASAVVYVVSNNLPLSGATVTATYSGPSSGTVSGNTNTSGKVTLKTGNVKNPSGTWCFTVTNVARTGYAYDGSDPQRCEVAARLMPETEALPVVDVTVYPNPFSDKTYFEITAAEQGRVLIELYDLSGKKIAVIANEVLPEGTSRIAYDSGQLPAGIYQYKVTAGHGITSGKLLKNK
jgi:hypothetical protein